MATERNRLVGAGVVFAYLAVIVVANLTTARWGPVASYWNAALLVGFAITARDYLHDAWAGHRVRNMTALIVSGSVLSYVASLLLASDVIPADVVARIALASFVAFAVSESVDAIAYHALRKRDWLERSNTSNLFSATLDSILFVTIAFGFSVEIVALQIAAKVAGGLFFSLARAWVRNDKTIPDVAS